MKDIRYWAVVLLAVMLGAVVVVAGYYHTQAADLSGQLTASQKSAREAWGKFYDLQEKQDDAQSAELSAANIKLWEAQQKLEACEKGPN